VEAEDGIVRRDLLPLDPRPKRREKIKHGGGGAFSRTTDNVEHFTQGFQALHCDGIEDSSRRSQKMAFEGIESQ
jgi:hypothetical protein